MQNRQFKMEKPRLKPHIKLAWDKLPCQSFLPLPCACLPCPLLPSPFLSFPSCASSSFPFPFLFVPCLALLCIWIAWSCFLSPCLPNHTLVLLTLEAHLSTRNKYWGWPSCVSGLPRKHMLSARRQCSLWKHKSSSFGVFSILQRSFKFPIKIKRSIQTWWPIPVMTALGRLSPGLHRTILS